MLFSAQVYQKGVRQTSIIRSVLDYLFALIPTRLERLVLIFVALWERKLNHITMSHLVPGAWCIVGQFLEPALSWHDGAFDACPSGAHGCPTPIGRGRTLGLRVFLQR